MKHTHRGHCQICERSQAVKNGSSNLAKHGYTVDFGFFNGTCPGSDNLPYELSAALLPPIAKSMRETANRLFSKAAKLANGHQDLPCTYSTNIANASDLTITKNEDGSFVITEYKRQDAYQRKNYVKREVLAQKNGIDFLREKFSFSEDQSDTRFNKMLTAEWSSGIKSEMHKLTEEARSRILYAERLEKRFADWKLSTLITVDHTANALSEVKVGDKYEAHDCSWEVVGFTEKRSNMSNRYMKYAICQRSTDSKRFNISMRDVRKYLSKV